MSIEISRFKPIQNRHVAAKGLFGSLRTEAPIERAVAMFKDGATGKKPWLALEDSRQRSG